MKKLLLFLSLSIALSLNAQKVNNLETKRPRIANNCAIPTSGNLVTNGNFEQFSSLPNSISQITKACGWSSPTIGTPDYFHRNSSSILVRIPDQVGTSQEVNPTQGGDAYGGFVFSGGAREMMRTKLTQPLEPNTEYILQFDISVADNRTGNLLKSQAYLGSFIQLNAGGSLPIDNDPNGILLNNDVFNSNTVGWDTITFTFTTGNIAGQEYLYLGTISDPELSSNTLGYNYIDNVVLKNATDCESACSSNPSIIANQQQNCSYDFISLHEVNDCTGVPEFLWSFTNSTITTSTEINPNVIPLNNGPLTVSLTITYDLSDGTQCSVSNSRTVNVTCFPEEQCGTCSDTEGEFPVVSDDTFFDDDRIIGKSITSDCSGNIYSIGFWDDSSLSLRKYDLNGNLIWNQDSNIASNVSYIINLIIEVDNNEEIYVKNGNSIKKYDINGLLDWEVQINGNPWVYDRSNFTLNKENGNIYLPLEQKTLFTNVTTNSSTIIAVPDLPINQSNVVKIDTNANITSLGAFPSSGILNLHYNNGLKLWSQNSANTGIEFRKYASNTDLLETTNINWVSNLLISQFDSFTPLFYNNINDEVYVYTGNITASVNNSRILSINNQGTINTNVLLQTALYINQHRSGHQSPFSFNSNNGEMAIYADRIYNYGGSAIISTISAEGLLNTKFLTSPFLSSDDFYSRSFHAITYGGDCLYFYGHYGSENQVTLTGGTILPSTNSNNDNNSVIIRLQDDLEIKKPLQKSIKSKNLAELVSNPIKNQTIQLLFNEKYSGNITFTLHDMSGNVIMEKKSVLNTKQEFNLNIDSKRFDILFLKIVRDDGYSQIKKVIIN